MKNSELVKPKIATEINKRVRLIFVTLIITLITSCFPVNSSNPEKTFEYWMGTKPPNEVQVIKGKYYQSPHFTLEYKLFLKLKTDTSWFNELVRSNNLELDTVKNNWSSTVELPTWFEIDQEYLIYARNQSDIFDRSRYFINPNNGVCYVFETVGM